MTVEVPKGLSDAFLTAASELGMCSAAWLFVREAEAESRELLVAMRDELGRAYPVFDAVAGARLDGLATPQLDLEALDDALADVKRVVVVGIEATHLDALMARRGTRRVALLTESPLTPDWARVLANYSGAMESVDLSTFQRWAGPHSALLTFSYGMHGASTAVAPVWLRIAGDDVRTQFGALIAWDVLGLPMYVYPRWLVEVATSSFTHVIP